MWKKQEEETKTSDEEMGGLKTVKERIEFDGFQVNRDLPILLSDHETMMIETWESFCDEIDNTLKTLRLLVQIQKLFYFLSVVTLIAIVYVGFTTKEENNTENTDPIVIPSLLMIMLMFMFVAGVINRCAKPIYARKLDEVCKRASTHDNDLTLRLHSDLDANPACCLAWCVFECCVGIASNGWVISIDKWCIKLELENVDVGSDASADVVGTETMLHPQKYTKGEKGTLEIHPEYKAWRANNGGTGSIAAGDEPLGPTKDAETDHTVMENPPDAELPVKVY